MPKRRMIASSIWRDEWFGQLELFEQVLWIGLFSSCADDQGRLLDSAALIRADVFPYKDTTIVDIENALASYVSAGRIIRYEAGGKGYVQIVHWWQHQHPQWAQPSHCPAPPGWIDHVRGTFNGKYTSEAWPPPEYTTLPDQVADPDENQLDTPAGVATWPDQLDMPPGETTQDSHVARQYLDHDLDHDHALEQLGAENAIDEQPPPKPRKPLKEQPPQIEAFREAVGGRRLPSKATWPAITNTVQTDEASLCQWKTAIQAWIGRGFNPLNISGMLDWYKNGIPKTGAKANGADRRDGTQHRGPGVQGPDRIATGLSDEVRALLRGKAGTP